MNKNSQILKEKADQLRLIDDIFFRLVASRKEVCQELLRTLLNEPELIVEQVTVQKTIPNLHRGVILDALCMLSDGRLCNVEVQKADENDDIRRTRFYAASITTSYTSKGTPFKDIPDAVILYITEYDALHNNQAFTEVRRCQNVKGEFHPIEDGERIYYANTVVRDGSKRSELLALFTEQKAFYDNRFKELSKAVQYYKNDEKGRGEMGGMLAEFAEEQRELGRSEGIMEGITLGRSEGITLGRSEGITQGGILALHEIGYTIPEIAKRLHLDEEKVLEVLHSEQ